MSDPKSEKLLRTFVITIDGPAGSGKSTTARAAARALKMTHIDTGAMYRAVTQRVLQEGVPTGDADAVSAIAETLNIELGERPEGGQIVMLDGVDVTAEIRSREVTRNVSEVSAHVGVRQAMVRQQRRLSDVGGAVMEGRDTGSVVLPWADVKIYLDASVDVRAQRRLAEVKAKGDSDVDFNVIRADIERRDQMDREREISPLKVPVGAIVVDTSDTTIDGQVEAVIAHVHASVASLASIYVDHGPNPALKKPWWWRLNQLFATVLVHGLWGIKIVRKEKREFNENYIYASNHRANFDPPAVAAIVRRPVYFVAKAALFENPIFGALIRSYQAIPIRRAGFDRAAMARFSGLLSDGASVLIFPEGGRQRTDELGAAKPGVGHLALRSGTAVVPVYVQGTASLFQSLFRRPRLTVIEGKPIRVGHNGPEEAPNRDTARDLGQMVMAGIAALQDEVRNPS